ncbi:alpha-1,4-N-acetylglucosaminyltransferase-like isoform X2 [Protopterus annectens]|nr:alpha-1,4-N-acetylglucosaminyltransferase-like isoform X2 [Protopterus annectens]
MPNGIWPWILTKTQEYCGASSLARTAATASLPVMFMETTETLTPHALAICSVESTARIYQDRPVQFYLRGFKNRSCLQSETECPGLRVLTDFPNVQLIHLNPKEVLKGTPLATWYNEDKVYKAGQWIRITSDAYRLALMWKTGGLYFDTDVIITKKVPIKDFVVCEEDNSVATAAFGFPQQHPYIMDLMVDFILNYNPDIWGQQGPRLFTRIMKKSCPLPHFGKVQDFPCDALNVTIMHPVRFYPIHWSEWGKYLEVWKEIPAFENSYGLHFWFHMSGNDKRAVVLGSNTLEENLFIKYCPNTYAALIKKVKV